MLGYCMHCKEKRSINDRYAYKTRHNKYMIKGTCNDCGRKICHMISKETYKKEKDYLGS